MSSYKEQLISKSLDEEEDLSDDEVYTKGVEENGASKPLMAPRLRSKEVPITKVRKVPSWRVLWAPIIYFLLTLSSIICLIGVAVFLINVFMKNVSSKGESRHSSNGRHMIPCSKISSEDVWTKTFPMLTTESAIRLSHVNTDGVEDIILGFGTGADAFYYPKVVCHVYFSKSKDECGGGLLAIDGRTGNEIWRHYSPHEMFAVNCNADLNGDGVKDCLGAGRMAGFSAINGKDGTLLWDFDDQNAKIDASNVYTPQFIKDIDFDDVPDIIGIHGGDPLKEPGSATQLIGRILVVSGKTGRVLKWVQVPEGKESYYSPQVLTHPDGTNFVLFGTGGETRGGSLWVVKLDHLLTGEIHMAKKIYSDHVKGIMTPPVLVDINKDDTLDIVMAMFNSSVIAFNGLTFEKIWEYNHPSSESYSTPGVGFFNNDSFPDFIINYQTGPGFPIYYFTQTTILDGQTGKPLLPKPIQMLIGTQSSPLVISVTGKGNDIFLYWVSDCHGKQNRPLEFSFIKGTSIHEQSRADFCKLRFKDNLFTRMYALTSSMTVPGQIIYDSDSRKELEYSNPINYTTLGLEFLYRHPGYQEEYRQYLESENPEVENRILQQDLSDLANRYDDVQLEKLLSADRELGQKYFDSEYNAPEYQTDNQGFPQYHSREYKNMQMYPSKYHSVLENFASVKKSIPPQMGSAWPTEYLSKSQNLPKRSAYSKRKKSLSESISFKNIVPIHSGKKRRKRHVGPHDGGGIQRVISTGTLAPALSKNGTGIDIIFTTFWFYPSETQELLPEDKVCIEERMQLEKDRFDPSSGLNEVDHDTYEDMITEECLKKTGRLKALKKNKGYNPFNRKMGQMSIYRLHLDCMCTSNIKHSTSDCSAILPFEYQKWPSYLGLYGNSIYGN